MYGSAKKYAEELSRITRIKAKSFKELKSLSDFETIIYIGALYAGGVLGLKKAIEFINDIGIDSKRIKFKREENYNCHCRAFRS